MGISREIHALQAIKACNYLAIKAIHKLLNP